jgi:hypothetical protein
MCAVIENPDDVPDNFPVISALLKLKSNQQIPTQDTHIDTHIDVNDTRQNNIERTIARFVMPRGPV